MDAIKLTSLTIVLLATRWEAAGVSPARVMSKWHNELMRNCKSADSITHRYSAGLFKKVSIIPKSSCQSKTVFHCRSPLVLNSHCLVCSTFYIICGLFVILQPRFFPIFFRLQHYILVIIYYNYNYIFHKHLSLAYLLLFVCKFVHFSQN